MSIRQEPSLFIRPEKIPCNFQEQEQYLDDILRSPDPFTLLSETIEAHIPPKTGYETYTGLYNQIRANPDNPQPRLKLLWLCLPYVLSATKHFRLLGINDHDIITQGLEITQEIINRWIPVAQPKGQDNLSFQINTQIRNQLKTVIVGNYGLALEYFPTVKLYLRAASELETQNHRPVSPSDLPDIKNRLTQQIEDNPNPRQFPLTLSKPDQSSSSTLRKGDVITQIHRIYTNQRTLPPNHNSDISDPGQYFEQKELSRQLTKAVNTLTSREREVLNRRFIQDHTLEKTAAALGLTREKIRQIEAKALRKLRHPSKRISDFVTD